ncbi:MAG: hypothetical protein ACYDCC_12180 [Actinomycetota bacterium]
MNNLELRRVILPNKQERRIAKMIAADLIQVRGQALVAEEVIGSVGRLTDRAMSETILLGEKQVLAAKVTGGIVDGDLAFLRSNSTMCMAQVITRYAQVTMP